MRAREFLHLEFLDPLTNWNLAPGYSAFLAATAPLTRLSPLGVAAIQAAIYFGAAYLWSRQLVRHGALSATEALLALCLALANPNLLFLVGSVGSEWLSATLLMLIMAAALSFGARLRLLFGVGLSVLLAAASLTRFEYLALIGLVPLLLPARRRALAAAGLAVIPFLALGLNAWRNWTMFGVPQPFSFGGGTVIYAGNNTHLDGSWHSAARTPGYVPPEAAVRLRGLEEVASRDERRLAIAQDRFFRDLAAEAWRHDPIAQLSTIPLKLGKLWVMPLHFDIYTADRELRRSLQVLELFSRARWPAHGIAKHAFYLAVHWTWLLAVALGLALVPRLARDRPPLGRVLRFTASLLVCMSVLYSVPFYGLPRFHGPLVPIATVLAALAVSSLIRAAAPDGWSRVEGIVSRAAPFGDGGQSIPLSDAGA